MDDTHRIFLCHFNRQSHEFPEAVSSNDYSLMFESSEWAERQQIDGNCFFADDAPPVTKNVTIDRDDPTKNCVVDLFN